MPAGSTWGALLWFVVILALIPLVLWLVKRGPLGRAGGSGGAAARVVGSTALSTQQRLVTIEVGQGEERLWLVLGVTPNSIRTLHTMAPQTPAPADGDAAPPPAAAFAQLLTRIRQGGPGHDAR